MAVDKDAETHWYIEKIIRKRRRQGKLLYYVKWEVYPKSFNSWIDSDSVIDKTAKGK